jgi:hypothetical protein
LRSNKLLLYVIARRLRRNNLCSLYGGVPEKHFADDNSRLAQWLRAIDSLNRGADFSEYAQDPVFRLLQNEVKMSNFSSRYLMTEAMMVLDKDYIFYDAQDKKAREVAKDLLVEGDSVEKVVRISKLSEADVLAIKAEIEKQ